VISSEYFSSSYVRVLLSALFSSEKIYQLPSKFLGMSRGTAADQGVRECSGRLRFGKISLIGAVASHSDADEHNIPPPIIFTVRFDGFRGQKSGYIEAFKIVLFACNAFLDPRLPYIRIDY
jgi:hypothetical protein